MDMALGPSELAGMRERAQQARHEAEDPVTSHTARAPDAMSGALLCLVGSHAGVGSRAAQGGVQRRT